MHFAYFNNKRAKNLLFLLLFIHETSGNDVYSRGYAQDRFQDDNYASVIYERSKR